jgi:dTDP-4-amino-4,6-dideoxygalactose transaminase
MIRSPHKIVSWFEEEVAHYTGAPFAVAVDNCTTAIRMCCQYMNVKNVTIPSRTYLSVPQSIIQAGGQVSLKDYDWTGIYQLEPYDIYDAAKRFTSDMYIPNSLMCLSFGIKKNLKLGKGGMILCDKLEVANELKRLRWSGRTEGVSMSEDPVDTMGDNSYITPEWAARGLMLLSVYPQDHPDQLEENGYPDLSQYGFMKKHSKTYQGLFHEIH